MNYNFHSLMDQKWFEMKIINQDQKEKVEAPAIKTDPETPEVHQHVKNHMMIYLRFIWKKYLKKKLNNFKINP